MALTVCVTGTCNQAGGGTKSYTSFSDHDADFKRVLFRLEPDFGCVVFYPDQNYDNDTLHHGINVAKVTCASNIHPSGRLNEDRCRISQAMTCWAPDESFGRTRILCTHPQYVTETGIAPISLRQPRAT